MSKNTYGTFTEFVLSKGYQTIRLTVTGDEGFSWSEVITAPEGEKITTAALRKFRQCHPGINVTFREHVVPDADRDALSTMTDLDDWF